MGAERGPGRPLGSRNKADSTQGERIKRGKSIYTDEFAGRVNGLVKNYPGTTMLSDLRLASRSLPWKDYKAYGFSYVTYPPDDWGPFYLSRKEEAVKIDVVERRHLSFALKIAMDTGFASLQQIRDASIEQLQEGIPGSGLPEEFRKSHLSVETAEFLKQAFQGPVETEGVHE